MKESYEPKCQEILKQKKIRFAGIIDENGKLLAGGFKEDVIPLEDDKKKLESFMKFVSMASIRKEYDSSLGPINYLAARRDKLVLVSFPFPITKVVLLISAEPTVNIEEIASVVVSTFSGYN